MTALPTFIVRHVLTDMDKTLVGPRRETAEDAFRQVLADLVAARQGLSREAAAARIAASYDGERECISTCLPRLGVARSDYWRALIPRLREDIVFYPDAAEMVRALHAAGFSLHPATTNSAFVFLAKLAVGRLAQESGTPYYRAVLGGSEICPEGKCGPIFYRCLMERFALDPGETVMIGDHPTADHTASREAGIGHVILIDRRQREEWIPIDGGGRVNSLRTVASLLKYPASLDQEGAITPDSPG